MGFWLGMFMWQIQFSEHCSAGLFGWERGRRKSWGKCGVAAETRIRRAL